MPSSARIPRQNNRYFPPSLPHSLSLSYFVDDNADKSCGIASFLLDVVGHALRSAEEDPALVPKLSPFLRGHAALQLGRVAFGHTHDIVASTDLLCYERLGRGQEDHLPLWKPFVR